LLRFQFPLWCRLFGHIFLATSSEAERTMLRGFTTVRDLGGPSFALKQAIDWRLISGPQAPLILSIFQERSGS